MSFVTGNPQWVCFINGLEVPIIAASTTTQSGGLASAQITMAYSPFLSKLPKHTKITLFSLDLNSNNEPLLEFDGTIQGISWRQDKVSGNTGLFVMAQTDGLIWSEREKFNFYIDGGFSQARLLQTTKTYESNNSTSTSPVTDPLAYILNSNNNDAGEVVLLLLTHTFEFSQGNVGKINYTDCGWHLTKDKNTIDEDASVDPLYYANYIKKFYEAFNVTRKLCRLPMPDSWKKAFQLQYTWLLLTKQIQPLEGKVNFWNYVTYICDMFNFEVYDIPDATMATISSSDINHINNHGSGNKNGQSVLSEYLIKPKTPFGPIPYCNVVFPDQVLDKSFFKNYQNETTRCYTVVSTFPGAISTQTAGLAYSGYTAPYFPDDTNNYFGSFNTKIPMFDASSTDKQFLLRSAYEDEFGVASKEVILPDILSRLLTTIPKTLPQGMTQQEFLQKNQATLQNMMNAEFFTSYTDKVSFTLQVTPDVNVVPGMSMLVLDENDDHMVAYCYGREKIWDKNGQQVINLKLMYPRHYSLQAGFANNYLNTLDPVYYNSSYKQDLSILSQYIGCGFLDQNKTIIQNINEIMTNWNQIGKNTPLLTKSALYKRTRTAYSQYLSFYNVTSPIKYDTNNSFNKMDQNLIIQWDISTTIANAPALQWSWAKEGYQNRQDTTWLNTASDGTYYPPCYNPPYNELNTPGPIKVSPYIAGIVNCHNRYLMQVGNNIS
jgi:hypothetical protein